VVAYFLRITSKRNTQHNENSISAIVFLTPQWRQTRPFRTDCVWT